MIFSRPVAEQILKTSHAFYDLFGKEVVFDRPVVKWFSTGQW